VILIRSFTKPENNNNNNNNNNKESKKNQRVDLKLNQLLLIIVISIFSLLRLRQIVFDFLVQKVIEALYILIK
jgi:hypothetical protein